MWQRGLAPGDTRGPWPGEDGVGFLNGRAGSRARPPQGRSSSAAVERLGEKTDEPASRRPTGPRAHGGQGHVVELVLTPGVPSFTGPACSDAALPGAQRGTESGHWAGLLCQDARPAELPAAARRTVCPPRRRPFLQPALHSVLRCLHLEPQRLGGCGVSPGDPAHPARAPPVPSPRSPPPHVAEGPRSPLSRWP